MNNMQVNAKKLSPYRMRHKKPDKLDIMKLILKQETNSREKN